jgi:hypothetical protein
VAGNVATYLEIGRKKIFAGALEWPGWCRSARNEGQALEALLAYASRYAQVVARSPVPFSPPADGTEFEVVERLDGNATTDFGAPGIPPSADARPMDEAELDRQGELLRASWSTFDAIVESATGLTLRKGPRGGGRDLDKIIEHVLDAEAGYLNTLGGRPPPASGSDPMARMLPLRETVLAVLAARVRGDPIPDPSGRRERWSPRYFLRRATWHVLDHAWEIEDRAIPSDGSA